MFSRFGFPVSSKRKIGFLREFFAFLHPNGIDYMKGEIASRRGILRLSIDKFIEVVCRDQEKYPNLYTLDKFHEFMAQTESLKSFLKLKNEENFNFK
jgi:hypothetical protein